MPLASVVGKINSGALKECLGTCVVIAGKKNSVKQVHVGNQSHW